MTTYKQGQRVRIEWPNGSVVEGVLEPDIFGMSVAVPRAGDVTYWQPDFNDGRVATILSEPPVEEPTRVGAVVRAAHNLRTKYNFTLASDGRWYREKGGVWLSSNWGAMNDPEILWEGPE